MPDINNTIQSTVPSDTTSATLSTGTSPSTSLSTGASTSLSTGASATLSTGAGQSAPAMNQAWNELDKKDASSSAAGDMAMDARATKAANVDIYAMPKEFQKHNTVAGGNSSLGVFVMLGALVLLLIAGSGAVLYYLKPELLSKFTGLPIAKQVVEQVEKTPEPLAVQLTSPIVTTTVDVATSTDTGIASSTPAKEIYLAYNIELGNINTFADYFALINKYGSARRVQQMEAEKLLADAAVDKGVATVAEVRKTIPILDPLARITDTVTDQTASLAIALTDNESKGTVDMIWEQGAWKLDNENWTLAKIDEKLSYVSGVDRDNDGLTDKEEDLLGSNKESSDSDSDGYSDAIEVSGLYDPTKKSAKLVDSGKFGTYLSEDGSYSIIRPSEWAQSKDNTDNSVNFRSSDDQYVKISTVENFDKLSLLAIYTKKFKASRVDSGLMQTNDTWEGITAPDGAGIYVMSKLDKTRYYILEYHIPAASQVQEYKAIFWTMVKSLVLKK